MQLTLNPEIYTMVLTGRNSHYILLFTLHHVSTLSLTVICVKCSKVWKGTYKKIFIISLIESCVRVLWTEVSEVFHRRNICHQIVCSVVLFSVV